MSLTKKELNRILEAAEKVDFNGDNAGDTRFTCTALEFDWLTGRIEFYTLRLKYQDFIKPNEHRRISSEDFEGRPRFWSQASKKAQDHRVIALLMFWASEGGK